MFPPDPIDQVVMRPCRLARVDSAVLIPRRIPAPGLEKQSEDRGEGWHEDVGHCLRSEICCAAGGLLGLACGSIIRV